MLIAPMRLPNANNFDVYTNIRMYWSVHKNWRYDVGKKFCTIHRTDSDVPMWSLICGTLNLTQNSKSCFNTPL